MNDAVLFEQGFKVALGAIVTLFAFLFNRSIKKNDQEIMEVKTRLNHLEADRQEFIKMSVKMDMMMKSTEKTNKTLDEVSKRVQGVELGVARLGVKPRHD